MQASRLSKFVVYSVYLRCHQQRLAVAAAVRYTRKASSSCAGLVGGCGRFACVLAPSRPEHNGWTIHLRELGWAWWMDSMRILGFRKRLVSISTRWYCMNVHPGWLYSVLHLVVLRMHVY